MEITLQRAYLPNGTFGKLSFQNELICETMEKPWRDNKRYISCIPEGRYQLLKRERPQQGIQLALSLVLNREPILIQPAKFSLSEMQGCIAPVVKVVDNTQVKYSRIAYERLSDLVFPLLNADEKVYIVIKSV